MVFLGPFAHEQTGYLVVFFKFHPWFFLRPFCSRANWMAGGIFLISSMFFFGFFSKFHKFFFFKLHPLFFKALLLTSERYSWWFFLNSIHGFLRPFCSRANGLFGGFFLFFSFFF